MFAIEGNLRLSPLRRALSFDARVDLLVFETPVRHVYGQQWIDFLSQGIDETITFPTVNVPEGHLESRGTVAYGQVASAWVVPYNMIWNRFFRHPSADADKVSNAHLGANDFDKEHGYRCGHLPHQWTALLDPEIASADHQFNIVNGRVDLLTLDQQVARLSTERTREFFASDRYLDVMRQVYGTTVNIDADQRPRLRHRVSGWLSGKDVDGTDAGSLGNYSGKAQGVFSTRCAPFRTNEHCIISVFILVRFPPLHSLEIHPLESPAFAQPSYKDWAGDAKVDSRYPPRDIKQNEFFAGGSGNVSMGTGPHANWHRTVPNRIGSRFREVEGFPLQNSNPPGRTRSKYVNDDDFDSVFFSRQLEHWHFNGVVYDRARVPVPDVRSSIFAGVLG